MRPLVLDRILVRNPRPRNAPDVHSRPHKQLQNLIIHTAAARRFLDDHGRPARACNALQQGCIQRTRKAKVDNRRLNATTRQDSAGVQRIPQHRSQTDERDVAPLRHERTGAGNHGRAITQPVAEVIRHILGIADGKRSRRLRGQFEHAHEVHAVARRADDYSRNTAQVPDIKDALVSGSVVADQPGAVDREAHGKAADADVVHDLVIRPLQEG